MCLRLSFFAPCPIGFSCGAPFALPCLCGMCLGVARVVKISAVPCLAGWGFQVALLGVVFMFPSFVGTHSLNCASSAARPLSPKELPVTFRVLTGFPLSTSNRTLSAYRKRRGERERERMREKEKEREKNRSKGRRKRDAGQKEKVRVSGSRPTKAVGITWASIAKHVSCLCRLAAAFGIYLFSHLIVREVEDLQALGSSQRFDDGNATTVAQKSRFRNENSQVCAAKGR